MLNKLLLFLCFSLILLIDGKPANNSGDDWVTVMDVNDQYHIRHPRRNTGFLAKLSGISFQYLKERISSTCFEDLFYLVDVFGENHTSHSPEWKWQQQMLDSYGALPAGIGEGNLFWMGDFNQCVKVRVWKNSNNVTGQSPPDFRGKYCVSNFNHYIPRSKSSRHGRIPIFATFGVCFPSTCTATDVEEVVNDRIKPIRAQITENECQTDGWKKLDQGTIIALTPFATLLALVVVGTAFECVPLIRKKLLGHKQSKKNTTSQDFIIKFLTAFSAYQNTKKVFDTSKETGEFSCINGIRASSMLLLVAGHTSIAIALILGRHNPVEFLTVRKKAWVQPLLRASVCVETFFFLTGFLVTYIVLERSTHKRSMNIVQFYVHRILRLAPGMALLAALAAGPHELLGNGPLWNVSPYYDTKICQESWWKTALFIHKYYENESSRMCAPHTWYLDVEMFYYILSPILLYPIVKRNTSGPIIWITLITASFFLRWNAENETVADTDNPYESIIVKKRQFQQIYSTPWYRPQAFLIGMFFGYVYYYYKKDLHLNKYVKSLSYLLVTITMLYSIFGNYLFLSGMVKTYSKSTYLLDNTYMPSAWSVCIGYIVIACATGNSGFVNKILSWKFLVPIGRLSFCAYLIHYNVLQHFSSSRKYAMYYDFKFLAFGWIALNTATLACAWMFSLLTEIPIIQLEHLLRSKTKVKDSEVNVNANEVHIPS